MKNSEFRVPQHAVFGNMHLTNNYGDQQLSGE